MATGAERAFRLFTESIGEWWPLAEFSVFSGSVAFEGAELVERKGEQRSVWAEVMEWDPPRTLRLAWHPGNAPTNASDLRVSFEEHVDGTIVTLVHSGWERTAAPERAAREYGEGWPIVLGQFAALVTETYDDPEDDEELEGDAD